MTCSSRERVVGYKCGDEAGVQERRPWVDYPKLKIYEDTL